MCWGKWDGPVIYSGCKSSNEMLGKASSCSDPELNSQHGITALKFAAKGSQLALNKVRDEILDEIKNR
jgi:hypothetical protein